MRTASGIIFILYVAFAGKAYACTCPVGDLEGEFRRVDAVFVGFVVRGEMLRDPKPSPEGYPYVGKRFHFEVLNTFKGKIGKQVEVRTGVGWGGDCGYPFELERSYLVFASGTGTILGASSCSRTGPLERRRNYEPWDRDRMPAAEDYEKLLELQKKP